MASTISGLSKTGRRTPGVMRSGVPKAILGQLDPATGVVWQHPRVRPDLGISGSHVRVTNPRAAEPALSGRTASLGMGGIGQRGRGTDF